MTDNSQANAAGPTPIPIEGLVFTLIGLWSIFDGLGGWVESLAWAGGLVTIIAGMQTRPRWGRPMKILCVIMGFWTLRLLAKWLLVPR